jgi:hypothetical protein
MIKEDRELLTELARLNTAMAPLALRIMEGTASAAELNLPAHTVAPDWEP